VTALVPFTPLTEVQRVPQPGDVDWEGTIRLDTDWRDVATVVGSMGLVGVSSVTGFAVTGGPVGLVGSGLGAFAAVVGAHKVAWSLARRRRVDQTPVAPLPVPVSVEVLEHAPGVYVEGAPRYA
jgi:hypothetical protein